jgi:chromosome segregation ATPase
MAELSQSYIEAMKALQTQIRTLNSQIEAKDKEICTKQAELEELQHLFEEQKEYFEEYTKKSESALREVISQKEAETKMLTLKLHKAEALSERWRLASKEFEAQAEKIAKEHYRMKEEVENRRRDALEFIKERTRIEEERRKLFEDNNALRKEQSSLKKSVEGLKYEVAELSLSLQKEKEDKSMMSQELLLTQQRYESISNFKSLYEK